MAHSAIDPAALLRRCYDAAIAAVQPRRALGAALAPLRPTPQPCWIIAMGKASVGMAQTIVDWLAAARREPAGGVIVAAEEHPSPHPALRLVVGDHPIPGARSALAADAIGEIVARIPATAEVHVAISGGTTALVAGPLAPLTAAEMTATFNALLSSGLDIREMNAVRKRVTRWSAGRLAAALAGRRVFVWSISDVPGDDPGSIGSGPCTGDPWTSGEVLRLIEERGVAERLAPTVLTSMQRETPKPDDAVLRAVSMSIVANNTIAVRAAAAEAEHHGVGTIAFPGGLVGEAAAMGRSIAAEIVARDGAPRLLIWGGETTVTITGDAGRGGRSQELALAAAGSLWEHRRHATLLAAGTDGRDGPTDAAGALIDGFTWRRIAACGRDPAADLARHDAYAALDAAGALVRTGPTGTNVSDLAIAFTR